MGGGWLTGMLLRAIMQSKEVSLMECCFEIPYGKEIYL